MAEESPAALGDIPAETVRRAVCAIRAWFFSRVVDVKEALGSQTS